MLFPAAAATERPLAVQDVAQDGGDQDGDRLRGDDLVLQHGVRHQGEQSDVDDIGGAADHEELGQLPVLDGQVPSNSVNQTHRASLRPSASFTRCLRLPVGILSGKQPAPR